ncbi:PREDICTED: venom acid phosphatase Acph-1-like [Papilio xuthus]|uniref:acid phosphatase n=1 Tax=Papilio xuthus TaxID=66420 RepID=A0AAJ7EJE4_PAPXU|nr:PREDICTED: venom acid phosphatase Acph-1-like [Papilio xuthus]
MHLLFCLFVCLSCTFAQVSIKYSAMLFSSGFNTSIKPYPTDPLRDEAVWPYKYSKLIDIGNEQHHALGRWFGERYLNASLNRCDPEMISARSIDEDVSIKSAQYNLAGMCLSNMSNNNLTKAYLAQQPIFITTVPVNDDEILAMKRLCPEYNKLKNEFINTEYFKYRLNFYKKLLDYLSEHTNKTVESYDDINEIYNILLVESSYNLTLPSWAQAVFPKKLEDLACYSYALSSATPTMARLLVGPLIQEIVSNMAYTMLEMPNDVTLSIYSGDDSTIGNVLNALNLFDGQCPLTTATIIMELLYDNSTNDFYVRILYRSNKDMVEPFAIDIPHCGTPCGFRNFTQIYRHLMSVDWKEDCYKDENDWTFTRKLIIILFLLIFCTFVHCAYYLWFAIDKEALSEEDYPDVMMVQVFTF